MRRPSTLAGRTRLDISAVARAALLAAFAVAASAGPGHSYPVDSTLVPPHEAIRTTADQDEGAQERGARAEAGIGAESGAASGERVASVDARILKGDQPPSPAPGVVARASAPTHCLPSSLMGVLTEVADRFGPVSIQSTHRSHARNRRAGGARGSLHLDCRAIDFRVTADSRAVMAFLRDHPDVGGLKRYRNGIIHIDDGERRKW